MKPLIMTMSGTRGIIGENLYPNIAVNIAAAFGSYVKKGPVIVGGDTRVSYEMLKNAVISGLIAVGIDVIDIGKVPTPTVQHLIKHYNAQGGIVITASHNPIMWNGIKLMNKTGSFLDEAEYAEYIDFYNNLGKIKYVEWDKLGKVTIEEKALEIHIDRILANIDVSSIQKSNLKVLVDPNNGTGCLANPILFEKLGIEYKMINEIGNGRFAHNPEPAKSNVDGIIEELKKGDYDIGFVQDADADRLVILDENGVFIGEDYSLALGIDYILSTIKEPDKNVVVNLSTSLVIEAIAKKYNAKVTYTKVGEANVTQGIKDLGAQVGGEGNGGVIYPKVGWGRDSLVGIIIALKYLAESKKTVSKIVSDYPKYVMLREKVEVGSRKEIDALLQKAKANFNGTPVNDLDGLKFSLEDAWAHIRPSNTEPIVRIFIEAKTKELAESLFRKINS
ncbi:phosphoglucosamine mutase [Candidatus Margulisiibacteriota bacterium]